MERENDRRDVDVAFCAGIFEGEGYAGVRRVRRHDAYAYMTPSIRVAMDDPEPVRFLFDTLGGSFRVGHTPSDKKRGRPPHFVWGVMTRQALRVALLLLPHCKSQRNRGRLQSIVNHYDPERVRIRRIEGAAKTIATKAAQRRRMTVES